MAVIAPFRGILYNPGKVGDMSKVVAPPYDVISPEGKNNRGRVHISVGVARVRLKD